MIPVPEGANEKERQKLYEEYIASLKKSIDGTSSINIWHLLLKREQK